MYPPKIFLKTKILHCDCKEDVGYCCIPYLNRWKPEYNLSGIIGAMYHFFLYLNPGDGYNNLATNLLKQDHLKFSQECEKQVRNYANFFSFFDSKFLFQGIYNNINGANFSSSDTTFIDITSGKETTINKNLKNKGDLYNLRDSAFIIGDEVFTLYDLFNLKEKINYKFKYSLFQ